jgi:hypothetical protein
MSESDDAIERWQIDQANGFRKVAGRRIMVDGLVARNGRRRILPNYGSSLELGGRAQQVLQLARQVLPIRDLDIYTELVIKPAEGRPGRSVADLMEDHGCSRDTIERSKKRSQARLLDAAEQLRNHKSVNRGENLR